MSPGKHRGTGRLGRFRPSILALEGRLLLNADVLTYHENNYRTSADLAETTLTPSDVNPGGFGKVGFLAADGKVDAQPLYKSGVTIPGQGTHNVVYVATEADSLYAFDADTGVLLWHDGPSGGVHPLLGPGETAVPAADFGSDQVAPTIGITSTPVINPSNGTIDVVAMSKAVGGGSPVYYQRIHALDLATGADRVAPDSIDSRIRFPGAGPGGDGTSVIFDSAKYVERDALTLENGVIYTGWSSHSDSPPYTGWVIGFRAGDLGLASVLNVDPNGRPSAANGVGASGNTFWNSGAGFAADASGHLYNISANGPFDPSAGDYGDSYLKLSTAGGLAVADYFTPFNPQALSDTDLDLGSSGLVLLPDLADASGRTVQLAVGSGKDGNVYVVDRNGLGHQGATSNPIHQEIAGALGGPEFGSPAYFDGHVYFGGVGATLRSFAIAGGRLSEAPTSASPEPFIYPGTSPTVSANGTSGGIVWAVGNGPTAVLRAFDAANLGDELYNSNQAPGGRDHFGPGNKFITPIVADGRVLVGTQDGVAVFGLLPSATPTPPTTPAGPSPIPPEPPTAPTAPVVVVPAFPSPSPTVGGFDLLGVVGTSGLGASGLTYTWSTLAGPSGAPAPVFSPNRTGTSNLVAVGIAAPGAYTFRVAIGDALGGSTASDVTVGVVLPVPRIAVEPFSSPSPTVGGPDFLGVVAFDPAFGPSALTYTWSTVGAPPGAGSPSFRPNGTGGSGVVAASFGKPGTYTLRVAVTNPFGQVAISDVRVVVGPRRKPGGARTRH